MLATEATDQVFVIIPVWNEKQTINNVLQDVMQYGYNIIVVDDGSSPAAAQYIRPGNFWLLRHETNLGQGAALQTGFDFAVLHNATHIISFDADGQHKASDINKLLQTLKQKNCDIVFGSRFMNYKNSNVPLKRKRLLKIARYVNYFFTGLLLSDAHNGLRAMTTAAVKKINLQENGMAHATEILAQVKKQKLSVAEVPVDIIYNDYSMAKGQTGWSSFRIFFDLLLNKFFK